MGAANESADLFDEGQLAYQRTFTAETGRATGYINLRHERDDIVRFTSIPVGGTAYPESFAVRLAQVSGLRSAGQFTSVPAKRIAWLWGPGQNLQPFLIIPAQDLLPGAATAQRMLGQLTGKIVLIGIDLPYVDRHRTPLSLWTGEPMIGVMIHAQILAQLLDSRAFSDLTPAAQRMFLGAVGLLGLGPVGGFGSSAQTSLALGLQPPYSSPSMQAYSYGLESCCR